MKILSKGFYTRDTAKVAKELLGKLLVRKLGKRRLIGMIVETEAYYGKEDPASRAYSGRPKYCARLLYDEPGKILVYNVHNNWLFNIIAHEEGRVGGVLIRAIEPVEGIELMKKNRKLKEIKNLTNGPGKLSRALKIDKKLNDSYVTDKENEILICDNRKKLEIGLSYRIGVTRDLKKKLRFFVKGNKFVSR